MMDHGGEALARAVEAAYLQGAEDYYLEPMVRQDGQGQPVGLIRDGDSVIFCCRRGEREIELTEMFTDPAFAKADRRFLPHVSFAILTLYHDRFHHLPVAFAPETVEQTLAQAVSEAGKTQLHCAESEKFAHVTFFLNGGRNAPFPGEEDICIPSPKGVPFEEVPALSLDAVADTVIARGEEFDFTVVNFANGDVIGHTANKESKLRAAAAVSRALERVVRFAEEKKMAVFITADHGNIETLFTAGGKPHVAHTDNRVAFLALDGGKAVTLEPTGALCDVAPTVLQALGIERPDGMNGRSLAPDHDFGPNRRAMLIILDGWGMAAQDENNAVFLADTPYWDELIGQNPHALLRASGDAVGLCAGKAGNSEAGHMNIGAGRVVAQDDVRLDAAIREGTFAKNPVLAGQIGRALECGTPLHLIAYLTHASSHGSIAYPLAILKEAKAMGLKRAFLHVIFDGRSTPPGSAPALLRELDKELETIGLGEIADGVGRGIVLDRDGNYEKVKRAYDAMVEGTGLRYT